jgi:hypothetical protein
MTFASDAPTVTAASQLRRDGTRHRYVAPTGLVWAIWYGGRPGGWLASSGTQVIGGGTADIIIRKASRQPAE